jgi:hypothetical protein
MNQYVRRIGLDTDLLGSRLEVERVGLVTGEPIDGVLVGLQVAEHVIE